MPFYQAVHILRKQDRQIKGVQVWYSDQNPQMSDIVINLSQDGIRLIFDSILQRLKVCCILIFYNVSRCVIYLTMVVLSSILIYIFLIISDQSFCHLIVFNLVILLQIIEVCNLSKAKLKYW